MKGSATGAQATQTVESVVGQAQTALRQAAPPACAQRR